MDEIREYEQQLADVREALEASREDELVQLETELTSLIAELRTNLPKFAVGDEVATKDTAGTVLEVLGHKMYKVQPYNEQCEPEGEPLVLNESVIRLKPLPPAPGPSASSKTTTSKATSKTTSTTTSKTTSKPTSKPTSPTTSPTSNTANPATDEFEQSRAKWKKFATSKLASGRVSKPRRA